MLRSRTTTAPSMTASYSARGFWRRAEAWPTWHSAWKPAGRSTSKRVSGSSDSALAGREPSKNARLKRVLTLLSRARVMVTPSHLVTHTELLAWDPTDDRFPLATSCGDDSKQS